MNGRDKDARFLCRKQRFKEVGLVWTQILFHRASATQDCKPTGTLSHCDFALWENIIKFKDDLPRTVGRNLLSQSRFETLPGLVL